jgi:predicted transcriptional regulator
MKVVGNNNNNSVLNYHSEKEFIKCVSSKYDIVRHLYPDKKILSKKIRESTGDNKGNFSRKIRDLQVHELIEVSTEKSGKGRPSQLVSLTNRGYEILKNIIDLSGLHQTMEQLPTHPNIALLYECLSYLESPENSVLKKLAADEFQLMSQKYIVPLESQFFINIKNIIAAEASNGVLHTVLSSLLNMIRNSDRETRKEIESNLGLTILILSVSSEESRIRKIAEEINAELFDSENSPLKLISRYLFLLKTDSPQANDLRNLIVKNVHPDQVMELRMKLLEEYEISSREVQSRIGIDLTQLR